jgi:hypothetical protein
MVVGRLGPDGRLKFLSAGRASHHIEALSPAVCAALRNYF